MVQGREPRTLQDRVDAIAKTIKCPQCRSESVYESRTAASEDIRRQIAVQVQDGRSADEIRASISAAYDQDLVLTPPSSGVGGLVWVLPVVAARARLRRPRRSRSAGGAPWASQAEPSDDDRALVAQARAVTKDGSAVDLDELARLEEERGFLLRSLDDLERERAAGDMDDVDYTTLRDGYTARAAAVLRAIEAGRADLPPRRPRRWGRIVAVRGSAGRSRRRPWAFWWPARQDSASQGTR